MVDTQLGEPGQGDKPFGLKASTSALWGEQAGIRIMLASRILLNERIADYFKPRSENMKNEKSSMGEDGKAHLDEAARGG